MSEAVKVMVRCRPMNQKQRDRGCINVIEVDSKNNQISLLKENSQQSPKNFTFDCVFSPESTQLYIYEQSAFSLVNNVLDGYNGTIFAYGQTGCGKTHTMMGSNESQQSLGIIPRTFNQIMVLTKNELNKNHLIRCSFIEIYNEQIHDLLSKDVKAKMELKESPEKGVFVKDLLQIEVESIQKMKYYMDYGFSHRAVRQTNMNAESSRSHSLFTIYIDSQETDEKGNQKYKASKLNLVDLAGSERAGKTGTSGDGLKEATKINLSLSALGNVISALVDGKFHHIPYRDSKLTRLLQDSLGGNTKTIMIAAISPANYNYDETLSTLRYASRAKFIQNKPKINEDPKDALLREYTQQIKKLKMMLEGKIGTDIGQLKQPIQNSEKIIYIKQQKSSTLEQQLKQKQQLLLNEKQQKYELQLKLKQLQKHFRHLTPNNNDKEQYKKLKKLKEKLQEKEKLEIEYREEKKKKEEELLRIESNYNTLNEQIVELRKKFSEIKEKYISNLHQLEDVKNEYEDEREELLDTIREQDKEIKKYQTIVEILMSKEQIQYILNNSKWNQEKEIWNIPYFVYKDKNQPLPKLSNRKESNQLEKEKKEVVFKNTSSRELEPTGFKVNNVLKNARQVSQLNTNQQNSTKFINLPKNQLTPLNDPSDKSKQNLFDTLPSQKKKKQKLNPIDSKLN